jgi:hypothetical protein
LTAFDSNDALLRLKLLMVDDWEGFERLVLLVGGAEDDDRDGKGGFVEGVAFVEGIDEEDEILQVVEDELPDELGDGRPSISGEEPLNVTQRGR